MVAVVPLPHRGRGHLGHPTLGLDAETDGTCTHCEGVKRCRTREKRLSGESRADAPGGQKMAGKSGGTDGLGFSCSQRAGEVRISRRGGDWHHPNLPLVLRERHPGLSYWLPG